MLIPHYSRLPCIALALHALAAQLFVAMAAAVSVTAPSGAPPSTANVVWSNFLGLSVELSFINYYFGNNTDQLPAPTANYLSALRARGSGRPMRVRIGGNSIDSSTYVPGQQGSLIQFTDPGANVNDQPVDFGPQLFDVMNAMNEDVGGISYLIGESHRKEARRAD